MMLYPSTTSLSTFTLPRAGGTSGAPAPEAREGLSWESPSRSHRQLAGDDENARDMQDVGDLERGAVKRIARRSHVPQDDEQEDDGQLRVASGQRLQRVGKPRAQDAEAVDAGYR